MLERRMDDYWNIEGNRDLSDSWTGFTWFTILDEKKTSKWVYMVRGAVDEEANNIQARLLVARDMERHVRSVEKKKRRKSVTSKNQSLTML